MTSLLEGCYREGVIQYINLPWLTFHAVLALGHSAQGSFSPQAGKPINGVSLPFHL